MLKYVSLVFLLLGVASAKKGSKDTIPANCTDQENFTLKPNEQVYINCQNDWDNISITIDSDGNAKEGLSLEFKSLTNFKDSNALKIYGYDGTTEKLIYQGNPLGTNFWLVTGQSKIRIEAKHVTGSTISVYVKQSCVQEAFDLPTFVSPILPNQPLSKPGIVNCNYKFTHPSIIDFTKVTLKKTSEAKFTGTSDDKLAGPFTNATPDHIVILQPNAVLALKLDLGDADQSLTFNKQIISDMKSCGDKQMITVGSPMTIPVSGLTNGGALTCDWLLVAPEGQKLTLTVSNMTLEHVEDLVSVVDGGLFSAKPLVQLTALNQKSSPVISSGRYLVVSLNSKNFDAKEGFSLTANTVSSGGHLYQNGTMSIQETGDFYLSTSDTEDLVVSFTALTRLNDSQKLVVYADSMELVTFDAAKPLFDISSPGSELRIVASGFSKTAVNLPFTSKPKGSACMRTFIAAQETGMKLIGKCDGQCTWIIKPNVQKEVTQMFMRVLPNNVPTGTITHFRNSDGKISLANSAEPFLLSYRVEDGALINFDCSNAKDFEMSYVTKVANQDVGRTVAAGQNFTLTSPFFPGIYPQGAVFNYSVNLPDPKISYLASFRIMDLLPGHNLAIGKNKDTQFTGSDLPGDVLIPAGEFATTIFDSGSVEENNPKGGYGFYIDLAPASSSQTLKDASKSISTGDQCNKPRCVYIIDLPKPDDKNSSVSVNLTVAIPKDRSLNESDLLVWDGESVLRSALIAPIANLTKGGFFASKSNKLVIVYKGALNLNMSFVASPCSYKTNTMCSRDRLCMPLSWRCDGTAQCSDGSDEWHCTGGHPPTPQPDPAPAPSSGWKVAFWLFMPVFMLLGVAIEKLVPKLIQRVRDSRYQQFHDLGDH